MSWTPPEAALLQSLLRHGLADAHATQPCMSEKARAGMTPTPTGPTQAVLCLCAQWCGVCREFRAVFDAAQVRHPEWLFCWIDVEDEAEQLDDLDIETFPTLVLGTATQTVFAGPVLPQAPALAQHLRLLANSRG